MAGEPITTEQLDRLCHRYTWATRYCSGKDVVELACGTGPGIGLLSRAARSFEAGDYSKTMVQQVRRHYGERVVVRQFDAQAMPYPDHSKDVLVIFEALYYLPDIPAFIRECRRVLRPGGLVLIATANKDLPDFNPSPYSHHYLGVVELAGKFGREAFKVSCYGYMDTSTVSLKQRLLRPVKKVVVTSGLMPKTMRGKQLMKRIVFGKPVMMPPEIMEASASLIEPTQLAPGVPDRSHKVIYCVATLGST